MAGENLTEQQKAFISQYLKSGLFSGKYNEKKTENYEEYLKLETALKEWMDKVPSDHPEKGDIIARLKPSLDAKNKGKFKDAVALLAPLVIEIEEFSRSLYTRRGQMIHEAALQDVPAEAEQATIDDMKAKRTAVSAAMPDDIPSKAQLDAGQKALDELKALRKAAVDTRKEKQAGHLRDLAANSPKAAAAAQKSFEAFDAILKGEEATEANIKLAGEAIAEAKADRKTHLDAYNAASALPEGAERTEKMNAAADAYNKAQAAIAAAEEKENALLGQKHLSEAIAHGPLSAETGRPLDDASAELIAKGFEKNATMANAAVGMVNDVEHPELVAQNLDKMMDHAANKMASSTGKKFDNAEYAENYATKLLKMGGSLGPDYFANVDAYIASGGQFDTSKPCGDAGAATFTELAQKRSVKLAGSLVAADGSIDTNSPAAQETLGHMMYHPDAMRNATPAMNAQMLKTIKTLSTDPTKDQASDILKGASAPTGDASKELVRKSLGKGDTDAVTDKDTRTAILSSMLKPLDQGPVGSCFTTAPARRMRETDPIKAMQALTDVATKSTYKPDHGVEVPVVTNIPPNEDPIMRSWEYTLATSTARAANASEKNSHDYYASEGLDTLKTVVGDTDWATKLAKLTGDISAAFIFVYNPVAPISGSADGSSTSGRYVLTLKTPGDAPSVGGTGEILSKADYQNAIGDLAVKSLGVTDPSEDATKIRDHVKTDTFMNKVSPDNPDKPGEKSYEPWKIAGGGQTLAATQTLFGSTLQQHDMIAAAPESGAPDEGARTTAMLGEMLEQFQNKPDAMITIRTVGQHGFNALPNHPSLDALKGATKTETAAKMDAELVQPGLELKNTDLDVDRAQWLFDEQVQPLIDKESDATVKAALETAVATHRPTAAMKPAALSAAVKAATDAYNVKRAEVRTEKWKTDQATAPSQAKIDEKKAAYEKAYKESTDNDIRGALAEDLGTPEFVIADTNWGDSRSHTFFVIAPDPTSGEPILWKKEVPPGKLEPAGRDWVDHKWASIE